MQTDKDYREWCELMQQEYNERMVMRRMAAYERYARRGKEPYFVEAVRVVLDEIRDCRGRRKRTRIK